MREYIIACVGVLGTIISASIAHLLTKRKYSADVDKIILENIDKAFALYKKLTEETDEKVDKVIENYKTLKQENTSMQNELDFLKKQVEELKAISCTIDNCDKRKKIKKIK